MIRKLVTYAILAAVLFMFSSFMLINAIKNYIDAIWWAAITQTVVSVFDLVVALLDLRIALKIADKLDKED